MVDQPGSHSFQRITLLPFGEIFLDSRTGLTEMGTVGAAAKCHAIKENWLSVQDSGTRPACRMVNVPGIIAIDFARGEAEGLGIRNQFTMLAYLLPGSGHLPAVVFTDENQRQRPSTGDMHGFMKIT